MRDAGGGDGGRYGEGGEEIREKLINTEDGNVGSNMQMIGVFEEGNQHKKIKFMLKLILQENFQKII